MRNYWDFRHACNPHNNYMHVTGNTLRYRDSLHFLWGKHLQCKLFKKYVIPPFHLMLLLEIGKFHSYSAVQNNQRAMSRCSAEMLCHININVNWLGQKMDNLQFCIISYIYTITCLVALASFQEA